MVNKLIIIGNVGNDAEMRYTPNGKANTTFNVATNYKYGEKEETTWFTIQTFGKTAEFCNEYVGKGGRVYVEGRVRLNQWDGQDGTKHSRLEVVADNIKLLDFKKTAEKEEEYIEPDDIPF